MVVIDWIMNFIPWLAVVAMVSGYWLQIYKIHKHKEVRDLSQKLFILLAVGFAILGLRAAYDGTWIFLFKNILSLIPVSIIIWQIKVHEKDHWHDDDDPICHSCKNEMEPDWTFCPYCGAYSKEEYL